MDGVAIIDQRLRASSEILGMVPKDRIKGGRFDGAALPALLITSISVVDRHTLAQEGMVRVVERVAVTARANSYRDQRALIDIVANVCPADFIDALGVARRISIHTAGRGPEMNGPADSFERKQDFRVTYDAPRLKENDHGE